MHLQKTHDQRLLVLFIDDLTAGRCPYVRSAAVPVNESEQEGTRVQLVLRTPVGFDRWPDPAKTR